MAQHGREDVQHIAILMTDSVSNVHERKTVTEADGAKGEQIKIFVVGSLRLRLRLKNKNAYLNEDPQFNAV